MFVFVGEFEKHRLGRGNGVEAWERENTDREAAGLMASRNGRDERKEFKTPKALCGPGARCVRRARLRLVWVRQER